MSILSPSLGVARVRAQMCPFIAREHFTLGWNRNALFRIASQGRLFKEWFLSGDGKIENTFFDLEIEYSHLEVAAAGRQITDEIEPQKRVGLYLGTIFSLMEGQPDAGTKGPLLVNGRANLFVVQDQFREWRMVYASYKYQMDGWVLGAWPLDPQDKYRPGPEDLWSPERRFFYRRDID